MAVERSRLEGHGGAARAERLRRLFAVRPRGRHRRTCAVRPGRRGTRPGRARLPRRRLYPPGPGPGWQWAGRLHRLGGSRAAAGIAPRVATAAPAATAGWLRVTTAVDYGLDPADHDAAGVDPLQLHSCHLYTSDSA